MSRPRRFLFVRLAAVVVALAVGAWLLWPRMTIAREDAAKVTNGMTLADVQAILGGPPGNYASAWVCYAHPKGVIAFSDDEKTTWAGDFGMLQVFFDEDGKVSNTRFHEVVERDTLLQSIGRWLGL